MADLWNNPLTRGGAALAYRGIGAVADVAGADRTAQGAFRTANNITNPNVGMNHNIVMSNGLPLVADLPGGLPARSGGSNPRPAGGSGQTNQYQNDGSQNSGQLTDPGGTAQASRDAQERAMALFGIESGISTANDGLGRLDGRLQTGLGNIANEYQTNRDSIMNKRAGAQSQYEQQRTGQLNEYGQARNENATEARSWLDAARRTLGTQGAGGGSAARYGVPYQAQQQVASANAADQSVNNRNIGALDSSWDQAEKDFEFSERELEDQRRRGEDEYRNTIETERATLLGQLQGLQGQRAIAQGGDFRAAQAAANPYTSKIQEILNGLDARSVTPKLQAREVTVGRPDLAGYNWARPEQTPVAQQDPTLGVAPQVYGQYGQEDRRNPVAALFGLDERQQYV